MNYLTQQAAIFACEAVGDAIEKIEQGLKTLGELAHIDSKQSAPAKEYFTTSIERHKANILALRRLQGELSNRAWQALKEETKSKENT